MSYQNRLPEPGRVDNGLTTRLSAVDWSDPEDGWGLALFWNWFIFGVAGVILGIVVSLWFLALLVLPLTQTALILDYWTHSKELMTHGSYGGKPGLYYTALRSYRSLYESDAKTDAMELLSNIWKHETGLSAAGKNHSTGSCEACDKRLGLINKVAKMQSVPGTDADDIERLSAKIEQQEMFRGIMKELA